MSDQPSLFQFSEPPPRSGRVDLFLALLPDEENAGKIHDRAEVLEGKHRWHGSLRPPRVLHATILPIGDHLDFSQEEVERIKRKCAAVASHFRPFKLTLDRALSYGTNKEKAPFVLASAVPNAEFCRLHQLLHLGIGIKKLPPFDPRNLHVTVAYAKERISAEAIDLIGWTVRDVVLIHSLVGKTEYRELGRWSFGG